MMSIVFLAIFVPLLSPPKPDKPSSASTSNGANGLINPDATLIPARDLMASSLLTRNSSATRGRASDSGIELSGSYSSDGDGATTSSQNPNVPESPPPVSVPTVGVPESPPPVSVPTVGVPESPPRSSCTTALFLKGKNFIIYVWEQITKIKMILSSSTTGPFNLGDKSVILAFETVLALITIRFQALGNSSSATLLSSFLVTLVAVSTVFAFMFTLIGWMLEGVHQAFATVCSCAGFIWVVLGFFSMSATFVPERLVWLVWAAGVVVALVFFYSLAKRMGNTSAESTPSSSV